MNSEQLREFYQQNFYYIVAAGVAIGLVFGAIPLLMGLRRKKTKLGLIGFVLSGVAGAFSPILSFLIAAVFFVLVLRKGKTATESSTPKPSE